MPHRVIWTIATIVGLAVFVSALAAYTPPQRRRGGGERSGRPATNLGPNARSFGARASKDDLEQRVREDPNDSEAWFYLALVYRRDGAAALASSAWQSLARALDAGTRQLEPWFAAYLRGWAAHELGELADAREHWSDALSIQEHAAAAASPPDPTRTWYSIARLRALLDRPDDAFEALTRAVDAGWINAERAETDPALETLRADPRFPPLVERMRSAGRSARP